MAVKIDGLRLWNVQRDTVDNTGNINSFSIFGEDSDQTLLVGLEKQQSVSLNGIATGNRISLQAGYSNDPYQALGEYIADFESKMDAQQGSGYNLIDDERGITHGGVVRSMGWTFEAGAPFEVQWELEFVRGRAAMVNSDTAAASVNPGTSHTLSGIDLGKMRRIQVERNMEVEVFPIAFAANPGENEVLSQSGVTKVINIQGEKTGNSSTRNTFDSDIEGLIGTDKTYTYSSAFPGYNVSVMVDSYSPMREAGLTRINDYDLTLIEGTRG